MSRTTIILPPNCTVEEERDILNQHNNRVSQYHNSKGSSGGDYVVDTQFCIDCETCKPIAFFGSFGDSLCNACKHNNFLAEIERDMFVASLLKEQCNDR